MLPIKSQLYPRRMEIKHSTPFWLSHSINTPKCTKKKNLKCLYLKKKGQELSQT